MYYIFILDIFGLSYLFFITENIYLLQIFFFASTRFLFTQSYIIALDVSSGNFFLPNYMYPGFICFVISNIFVYHIFMFSFYWYFFYLVIYFCTMFLDQILYDAMFMFIVYPILHHNWWCVVWEFVYYLLFLHHRWRCDNRECCFLLNHTGKWTCFSNIFFCSFCKGTVISFSYCCGDNSSPFFNPMQFNFFYSLYNS